MTPIPELHLYEQVGGARPPPAARGRPPAPPSRRRAGGGGGAGQALHRAAALRPSQEIQRTRQQAILCKFSAEIKYYVILL